VVAVGDDKDLRLRDEAAQALDGLLEQRAPSRDPEELLR